MKDLRTGSVIQTGVPILALCHTERIPHLFRFQLYMKGTERRQKNHFLLGIRWYSPMLYPFYMGPKSNFIQYRLSFWAGTVERNTFIYLGLIFLESSSPPWLFFYSVPVLTQPYFAPIMENIINIFVFKAFCFKTEGVYQQLWHRDH